MPAPGASGIAAALELATVGGLGLVGPGAVAAVRSLILQVESESGSGLKARVLISEPDLVVLLDGLNAVDAAVVTVMPTMDAVLEELAAGRASQCFVVCRSSLAAERRLGPILRGNDAMGVVVLGRWKSGDAVIVDGAGVVVGASTRRAWRLVGSRLFRSPDEDLPGLRIILGCPSEKPLALGVLGGFELVVRAGGSRRDIGGLLTPKQQELLVFLAVAGEGGARRETVNRAVWPGSPMGRPYNSLHNALSLFRRAVERATDGAVRDVVVRSGSRYLINADLVDVDYWGFQNSPLLEVVDFVRGDLGDGITSLWIEEPRADARKKFLDAISGIICDGGTGISSHVETVLERMRLNDPYDEDIYREMIRAQLRLGRIDAARRTFAKLVMVLQEIAQRPGNSILDLMDSD